MAVLPTLTDETIVLRPWVPGDAGDLQREIQDPEIVRWLGIELPYTLDDAAGFIAKVPDRWEQRAGAHFAITGGEDGALLGYLGVLDAQDHMRIVEIVYWVAAHARGNGVATRALALALPWIRDEVGPDRIELGMVDGNAASAAVAEANGFTLRTIEQGAATLDGRPAAERIYEWTAD